MIGLVGIIGLTYGGFKMNRQDIKNKLSIKDQKVVEREAKTIEYVNLVKDDVVEYIFSELSSCDFNHEFIPINSARVLSNLYSKLGIRAELLIWTSECCGRWSFSCFEISNLASDAERLEINFIRNSFCLPLFEELIDGYLEAKGFKICDYGFQLNRTSTLDSCSTNSDKLANKSISLSVFDLFVFSFIVIAITFVFTHSLL